MNSLSSTGRLPGAHNQVTAQTLAGYSVICNYKLPKHFIKLWDSYSLSTAFDHLHVSYMCLCGYLLFITSCVLSSQVIWPFFNPFHLWRNYTGSEQVDNSRSAIISLSFLQSALMSWECTQVGMRETMLTAVSLTKVWKPS